MAKQQDTLRLPHSHPPGADPLSFPVSDAAAHTSTDGVISRPAVPTASSNRFELFDTMTLPVLFLSAITWFGLELYAGHVRTAETRADLQAVNDKLNQLSQDKDSAQTLIQAAQDANAKANNELQQAKDLENQLDLKLRSLEFAEKKSNTADKHSTELTPSTR